MTWKPRPGRLNTLKELVRAAIIDARENDPDDFMGSLDPDDDHLLTRIATFGAAATHIPHGTIFFTPTDPAYRTKFLIAASQPSRIKTHTLWLDTVETPHERDPKAAVLIVTVNNNGKGDGFYLRPKELAAVVRLFTDMNPDEDLLIRTNLLHEGDYLADVANYLDCRAITPNGQTIVTGVGPVAGQGNDFTLETTTKVVVPGSVKTDWQGQITGTPAEPQWKISEPQHERHSGINPS